MTVEELAQDVARLNSHLHRIGYFLAGGDFGSATGEVATALGVRVYDLRRLSLQGDPHEQACLVEGAHPPGRCIYTT